MEIESLTQFELMKLKFKIKEKIAEKIAENNKDNSVFINEKIAYISNFLGYNIIEKNRKRKYTYARFCLINYFRNCGYTWTAIALGFNSDHSSIIYGLGQYKNNFKYQFEDFMEIDFQVKEAIKLIEHGEK